MSGLQWNFRHHAQSPGVICGETEDFLKNPACTLNGPQTWPASGMTAGRGKERLNVNRLPSVTQLVSRRTGCERGEGDFGLRILPPAPLVPLSPAGGAV